MARDIFSDADGDTLRTKTNYGIKYGHLKQCVLESYRQYIYAYSSIQFTPLLISDQKSSSRTRTIRPVQSHMGQIESMILSHNVAFDLTTAVKCSPLVAVMFISFSKKVRICTGMFNTHSRDYS